MSSDAGSPSAPPERRPDQHSPPKFEGRLQGVRAGHLLGWAWDPAGPDTAESVQIFVDGKLLREVRAGESREHLRRRGLGSGQHGFRLKLPEDFFDGEDHEVAAKYSRTGGHLGGSPAKISCEPDEFARRSRPPYDGAPPNGKAMTLIGRNGWPFLCNTRTMDQLTGRLRLTERQLEAYADAFGSRWKRFAELDIPYVFAAAPMKELIYHEYLPPELELSSEPFPFDQLLELFRDDPSVHILDLRPVLAEAKRHEQVYYRTDHHLNMLGGYRVYRALLKEGGRFVAGLNPKPIDAFRFTEDPEFRGDLANKKKMTVRNNKLVECGLPLSEHELYSERAMYVDPASLSASELPGSAVPSSYNLSATRKTRIFENPDAPDLTAVIVRDSFMEQVMPFLSEHFRRAVYVWVPNPPFSIVEEVRPDIVIQLIAERFLIRSPLMPGWEFEMDTPARKIVGAAERGLEKAPTG